MSNEDTFDWIGGPGTINDTSFKAYGPGTKLFCDFHVSGKPEAVCIEVIEEGHGKQSRLGKIKVRLTETVGAWKKGEELVLCAYEAVPKAQERPLKRGEFFRRLNTCYKWVKEKQ